MRSEVTQIQLKCDACLRPIDNSISITGTLNYAVIGEADYCPDCSTILLEELFNADKFTIDDTTKFSNHYAISALRAGNILC